MPYQTTVTQKGQITIPKSIRDALQLIGSKKVIIELEEGEASARITPVDDFLAVAKSIRVRKKVNPLRARAIMESSYARS